MLDLGRNDVGQVARGSVKVDFLDAGRTVFLTSLHIVSQVTGQLEGRANPF